VSRYTVPDHKNGLKTEYITVRQIIFCIILNDYLRCFCVDCRWVLKLVLPIAGEMPSLYSYFQGS